MKSELLKVMVYDMVKFMTWPLRCIPIKKNRILFTGLTGGTVYDYSCNPKYLYEYMKENYKDQFEYIWLVRDIEQYSFLKEEGVKLVKHFTVSSFPMLLTAQIIITNGSYAPWFPFRKKQYVINTWHGGGAYKKIENERPDANWATKKRAEICANNIDLFLASCKMQEENMIRKTFCYKGEVLRAGTPRNDMLFNGNIIKVRKKVRNRYHLNENSKIVLYAPTYRNVKEPVWMDGDYLLEQLQNIYGEEWTFMCRYHRYQVDHTSVKVTGNQVLYVDDYEDMQELIGAADMLITDYSSSVWDYAILKKPCFLYVPDKEDYKNETGFYVDIDLWPFLQAKNMEDLVENIKHYDPQIAKQSIEEHFMDLGSYESGIASKATVDKILDHCSK